MKFQVRYLALFFLFSVIDNFGSVLDEKSSQEYSVNSGVLQGSIPRPTLSYYTLMAFLMMSSVILLSMLMILLSTLSVIRQQLELASELESDLRDTVDWDRKWLVDFNAAKTQLVSCDWSVNTGAIDPKNGWVCS